MTGKGTDLEGDLEHIAGQERRLRFERFDAGTAWELGSRLKATAEAKGAALVIDVSLCGRQLFHYAMPGTTPDNADWARRKRIRYCASTAAPTQSGSRFSGREPRSRRRPARRRATTLLTVAASRSCSRMEPASVPSPSPVYRSGRTTS